MLLAMSNARTIRAPEPTPGDLRRQAYEAERAGRWMVAAVLRNEAAELETVKCVTDSRRQMAQNGLTV